MDAIAREVEPSLGYRHQIPEAADAPSVGNAMSNAACDLAEALRRGARSSCRRSAAAPRRWSRGSGRAGRSSALSHHQYALQQMALEWGVTPLLIPESPDVEDLWNLSIASARDAGLVQPGDRVVITAGTQVNIPGSTNVIKVERGLGASAGPRSSRANMASRCERRQAGPSRVSCCAGSASSRCCFVALSYYKPARTYLRHARHRLAARGGGAEAARAARAARTACRRLDERRRARARGAPARTGEAGRAAVHRQGHQPLAEAAR